MDYLDQLGLLGLVTASVAVGGAFAPLLRTIFEKALGLHFDKRMEEFKYGVRVREQAAKVAEYLALHMRLNEKDSKETYARINQVGWELALYLPPDVYLHVRDAVARPTEERNTLTALVAVRGHLLGAKAGKLDSEQIAFHAPGAGKLMAE